MTHSAMLKAIYTKISGISGLPTILYPNRSYPNDQVPVMPLEYVRVFILPAEPMQETFTLGVYKFGIIQLNVVIPDKVGDIKAYGYADSIISVLKNGTVISGNLKVAKPPYTSGGINDGSGHYTLPVTVPYKILDDE